ncbi:hypothetical protein M427DRAFT_50450 [Gonapodya prolifera JEL478]|uniref:Auxin efflux carrier n=1 Tax=Gonapodya prolifera (strain JEL478) TaxID=1344416 RepID=A0A139AZE6_GONPJ|nr:hypothetical protein M427DRAFT_50450 [Gonapodya prolifera JEL478]|eukprot:KXS22087.1 hypothetical protein M427DRAFT_50450 [Gonapodya prolifera JEL478]
MSDPQAAAAKAIAEVGVPIIAIVLLAAMMAAGGAFPTKQALPWLNKFVFYVAIPSTVFKGLATQDFIRDKTFDWGFIGVFLMLRIFVGLLSLIFSVTFGAFGSSDYAKKHKRDWIGHFLTHWIAETYINTLIFGIPVLKSIYGPNALLWNVLASISSLFFQLPIMLVFFEYRKRALEERPSLVAKVVADETDAGSSADPAPADITAIAPPPLNTDKSKDTVVPDTPSVDENDNLGDVFLDGLTWHEKSFTVLKLGLKGIATNPPMWGIFGGIFYSLVFTSTINGAVYTIDSCTGKHLYPIHFDYALQWLSDTITPLASFCIGLFAFAHWRSVAKNWKRETIYILLKMIVVPLFTIPLVLMFNVQPAGKARGAILIAAMPIALASFSLTNQYDVGQDSMASQVIIGTILMTPCCVAWDAIMQSLNLFGNDTLRLK